MRKDYIYKRVVLIGVDGAGTYFKDAETPHMDRIFENGAMNDHVLTARPTISAECWGAMLIGVTAKVHRITNYSAGRVERDPEAECPSVFRVIHENNGDAKLASFCNWWPINYGIIESNFDIHKANGKDGEITEKICEYLTENDPTFLFVQYDEVDHAGHCHGYGSEEFLEQIRITDGYIGKIYNAYQEQGLLEDTLFMVTADHGGIINTHGGDSDAEKYVLFAASGKTVMKGNIDDMDIRDCAAIVLHALGMEQPKTWTARVPSGLFEGVTAVERPVNIVEEFVNAQRAHNPEPTPTSADGKGTLEVIGKDRVLAYLPLDGDISDKTNNMRPARLGKLYFVEGYFGQGTQFEDGGILLGTHSFGKNSFSVALWVKTSGTGCNPSLFSNKDRLDDNIPGYELRLGDGAVHIKYGDGNTNEQILELCPEDFRDGWMHLVFVVDREASEIRFCFDFGEFHVTKIPEQYKDLEMNGNKRIYIGTTAPNNHTAFSLYAVLDEYIIVDGILEQEDVRRLKEYYGVS